MFCFNEFAFTVQHTHTHTRLTAYCPGQPGWAGTRKVKPKWILLKQEKVSGSGIRWAICKSAPRSTQITMPVPHRSVFYRLDALPAAQPTSSKHWRHAFTIHVKHKINSIQILGFILMCLYFTTGHFHTCTLQRMYPISLSNSWLSFQWLCRLLWGFLN